MGPQLMVRGTAQAANECLANPRMGGSKTNPLMGETKTVSGQGVGHGGLGVPGGSGAGAAVAHGHGRGQATLGGRFTRGDAVMPWDAGQLGPYNRSGQGRRGASAATIPPPGVVTNAGALGQMGGTETAVMVGTHYTLPFGARGTGAGTGRGSIGAVPALLAVGGQVAVAIGLGGVLCGQQVPGTWDVQG